MENLTNQALLMQILDLFAQRFERNAILGGGMVLRLLGSSRYTNDLDYIFVPFKSKNEVIKDILKVLSEISDAEIEHSLNSKCLRITIKQKSAVAMVEVKVEKSIATEFISTAELAEKYNYPPRIIKVVGYNIALANKMAAWNERRIIRDVYDIWFFLRMGVKPDVEVLKKRLKRCRYSRLVNQEDYFKGKSVDDFFEFMRTKVNILSDETIANSLKETLNEQELAGLGMRIRAELARL